MILKNGVGKCSLFVLSASGRKDQNMDSSFSPQSKPWYGEGIVLSTGEQFILRIARRH